MPVEVVRLLDLSADVRIAHRFLKMQLTFCGRRRADQGWQRPSYFGGSGNEL